MRPTPPLAPPLVLCCLALACGPEPVAATPDEPLTACAASYAGCGTDTPYVDFTDAGTVTVAFGGTAGNAYSPKCIKVKTGTTVVFEGAFGPHPLQQACAPTDVRSIATTKTGSTASFQLSNAGDLGYYCIAHASKAGAGMAGAIQVVP